MSSLLIQNGRIIDPVQKMDQQGDLGIVNGKIHAIDTKLNPADYDTCIDIKGMVAAPGLADVHVHFRDPGLTYKEDIATGSAAAARGGFTTVITMANTKPAADSPEIISYILEEGKKTGIRVLPAATITKGMQGQELVDMEELVQAGAVGFTDDGVPICDETLVIQAMKQSAALQMPLSFHEEDPHFIKNPGINHGIVSDALGIEGAYASAEYVLTARDVMLALATGASINIQHISSKEAVAAVAMAKKLGANVHAEATPHHFSLTQDAVLTYGTLAKMNPPLRTEEDRQAILAGLADGTIDLIATDHAPHSEAEKAKELLQAPSGIIGLETSLALGITNLVRPGHLSLSDLLQKMSYNPLQLYHLEGGTFSYGTRADLVIFDPDCIWSVENFASKASNSPFLHQKLYGKVLYTICEGKIVYQDQSLHSAKARCRKLQASGIEL